MASSRRNRRRDERRAQAVRSRDSQRVRQGDLEPGLFARLSGDWIVGGLIVGVVLIAIFVFLLGQILRSGNADPGFLQVSGITVDPSNTNVVLLADSSGLFRSMDGGDRWEDVAFNQQQVHSVVADTSQEGIFYAAGEEILARSTDNGLTWQLTHQTGTISMPSSTTQACSDPATAGPTGVP